MGQPKVYKRMEHEGEDYLLLSDQNVLEDIDLSWVRSDDDLKEVLQKLHDYESTGAKWFWIETGVPVKIKKTKTGFTWLAPDTRDNSMKYKWLRSKVERYEARIVETINKYGEEISAVLHGEEDESVNAGAGESDRHTD